MASSVYPRSLSYFVKRLSNYSRNTYKLQTLNTNTASAGQIITVDLPNNALVDLNTLTWYFEGSTTATGTSAFATFPKNIESIIERVEVEINGQLITPGCSYYHTLFNIVSDTTLGEDCTNRRALLQNSLNLTAAPAANNSNTPFTIVNWLGFLGSVQPTVLDTNLLGNVRIRITLASANVLAGAGTITAIGYTLANMFFSVDCISIDDGVYYNLHDQFLSKGGIYELPFNNYYSFSQAVSGDGAIKFSLSTQSLNNLWASFIYGNGTTAFACNTVDVAGAATGSAYGIGSSYFFLRGSLGVSGWQFNINNQYVPNYRPNQNLTFTLLMNSYGMSQDTLGGINKNLGASAATALTNWQTRYWVAGVGLDQPCAPDERFISGLNTMGNVAQAFFEYTGSSLTTCFNQSANGTSNGTAITPTSVTGIVFAQTSPVLQVGAGRQLNIIL